MTEERSTHTEEQEKEPRPWRPTNRQALWAIGLVVALVTIILLVANLYPAKKWQDILSERVAILIGIGVALVVVIVLLAIGGASLGWTGFADKTLWEWLQLFGALAIPLVLAIAGFWFATQQEARQKKFETLRAKSEGKIEEQRAQDAALQAYLDEMSTLLLNKDLRNSGGDSEVRTLAQARTATVIQRLDAEGNRNVIRFLSEASLTGVGQASISLLAGADLQGAHLEGVDLSTIDLSDTVLEDAKLSGATLKDAKLNKANLSEANLSEASLLGTELNGATLDEANLSGAILTDAKLSGASMLGAILEDARLDDANLSGATLDEANLSDANLNDSDLRDSALLGANLNNANLFGAILEDAKLSGATLRGAILGPTALSSANLTRIFEDDFSDPSSGWGGCYKCGGNNPYVTGYTVGGGGRSERFRLKNPPPSRNVFVMNDSAGTAIEDAIVQVDATVIRNAPERGDTNWGIICHATADQANYYQLGISADGRPTISKVKDNEGNKLATGTPSNAFSGGTAKNHLRADCSGSKLTLYVNDQRVLQAEDSEFKSGMVGLFAEQNGEAIDVLFDNFFVNGPKPVITAQENIDAGK